MKHFNSINKRDILKILLSCMLPISNAQSQDSNSGKAKRIAVIGAGMAGLAAANHLQKLGHNVTVIEGRERIGGRIWTSTQWPNMPLDLGATWIHGTQGNPLTALADRLNAKRFATNSESAITYGVQGQELTTAQTKQLDQVTQQINKRLEAVQDDEELESDISVRRAIMPLLKGLDANSDMARMIHFILNSNLEQEYGGSIDQLSAQYFDESKELPGGDKFFAQGFQVITQHLAEGLNIKLSHIIKAIDYSGNQVAITTSRGVVMADQVIVTLPLGVLKSGQIVFKPALPLAKQKSLEKMQMGVLNKCYLRFEKAFWPTNVDWLEVIPAQHGHWAEWISFMRAAKWPVLLGFNAADRGREIERMSDAEIVQDAMKTLKNIYGNNIPKPIDFQITRWAQDPFSLGSYSFNQVGYKPGQRDTLAASVNGKVFFAGEATHKDYYGTAHGAYMSGLRAAREVAG